ncbi:MAG: hypothetical protein C0524_12380 [Rhodobacter sp.]|nr:hypothetical protein [Rhodobacter sp.]
MMGMHARRLFWPLLFVLSLAASAAMAEDAVATTSLNVRSGPGSGFSVVDVLAANERVTMSECQTNGWCYITHDGPDGWVSASYLAPVPGSVGGGGADCRLVIEVGSGGPTFRFECGGVSIGGGEPAPEIEPEPDDEDVGACFWRNTNYTGSSFCGGPGTVTELEAPFNDSLSSLRLYGGAKVRLCEDTSLDGYCRTFTSDTASLGPLINNRASSLVVFTGPIPPVELVPLIPLEILPGLIYEPPVTLSSGLIDLQIGRRVNLDNGVIGSAGADLRLYRAGDFLFSPVYLEPVGGAELALGDGSNRGRDGCRSAAFSGTRIRAQASLVGSYVCARTGAGRISQFRVNAVEISSVKLGYTTWSN